MSITPTAVKLAKTSELWDILTKMKFPDFRGLAACEGEDTELFFSDFPEEIAQAKAMCAGCPVIKQCASWGIRFENYGIFGGMTPRERLVARGGREALTSEDAENLRVEMRFILKATASQVAQKYQVDVRTVRRWRGLLRYNTAAA